MKRKTVEELLEMCQMQYNSNKSRCNDTDNLLYERSVKKLKEQGINPPKVPLPNWMKK